MQKKNFHCDLFIDKGYNIKVSIIKVSIIKVSIMKVLIMKVISEKALETLGIGLKKVKRKKGGKEKE